MMLVAKHNSTQTSFGTRLKEIRVAKGLTQTQLGDLVGMANQTIGKYEKGVNEPTWPAAVKLADALGVSLDAFRTAEPATVHSDLSGNRWRPSDGTSDGPLVIEEEDCLAFIAGRDGGQVGDGYGHGTQVAGIIGATQSHVEVRTFSRQDLAEVIQKALEEVLRNAARARLAIKPQSLPDPTP